MAIAITIQNRQRSKRVNMALLRRITTNLFSEQVMLLSGELGVCLIADEEMTKLNEGFLRHEGSTDVITFDYSELGTRNPESGTVIHGELYVCVDEAQRQARRFKTTWQSEVVRYIVHGVLHLLGHDDKRAAARKRMKRKENKLVSALAKKFPISKLARAR
jgi:probable rRNA maturation factor